MISSGCDFPGPCASEASRSSRGATLTSIPADSSCFAETKGTLRLLANWKNLDSVEYLGDLLESPERGGCPAGC